MENLNKVESSASGDSKELENQSVDAITSQENVSESTVDVADKSPIINLSSDICFTKLEVNEESRGTKPGVLSTVYGPFQFFEVEGNNERWYPSEIAELKIINTPYVQRGLRYKTLLGECHHPDNNRYSVWADEASHNVIDLRYDKDKKIIYGTADILDTPKGRIMQTLIDYGSILGVSARSFGRTIKVGKRTVVDVDSYTFKAYDFTTNPGFNEARVTLNEETQDKFVSDIGRLVEESNDYESLSLIKSFIKDDEAFADVLKLVEEKLDTFEPPIDDLEFKYNQLSLSYDGLLQKSKGLSATVDNQLSEINSLREENEGLRRQIGLFEEQAGRQNEKLKALNRDYENRQDTHRHVVSSINEEFQHTYKSLNEEIAKKDAVIQDLSESLRATEAELTTLRHTYGTSQGYYSKALEAVRSLQYKLQEQKKSILQNQSAMRVKAHKICRLNEENSKLKTETGELRDGIESVELQLSQSKTDLANSQAELERLQAVVRDLKTSLETEKSQVSASKVKVQSLTEKRQKAQDDLKQVQSDLKSAREEIKSYSDEIKELKQQIKDQKNHIKELEVSLSQQQAKNNQVDSLQAVIDRNAETIKMCEETVRARDKIIESNETAIRALTEQVAQKESQIQLIKSTVSSLTEELSEAKSNEQEVSSQLSGRIKEISNLESTISNLNEEVAKLKMSLSDQQALYEEAIKPKSVKPLVEEPTECKSSVQSSGLRKDSFASILSNMSSVRR